MLICKGCVRNFLSSFYFSPNDRTSKTMKNVLFHLKSSFRSRGIQIFAFSYSSIFSLSVIALEVDSRKFLKFMMPSTV